MLHSLQYQTSTISELSQKRCYLFLITQSLLNKTCCHCGGGCRINSPCLLQVSVNLCSHLWGEFHSSNSVYTIHFCCCTLAYFKTKSSLLGMSLNTTLVFSKKNLSELEVPNEVSLSPEQFYHHQTMQIVQSILYYHYYWLMFMLLSCNCCVRDIPLKSCSTFQISLIIL